MFATGLCVPLWTFRAAPLFTQRLVFRQPLKRHTVLYRLRSKDVKLNIK